MSVAGTDKEEAGGLKEMHSAALNNNSKASPEERHRDLATTELAELLREAIDCIKVPSASQAKLIAEIEYLAERLVTERFQLAVLGQFKRGKSTLLNALLGEAVLPTGVVPVTAIPTFLQEATAPGLRVAYNDGRIEAINVKGTDALREKLTALVTEEANPHNRFDIARVDVFLPSDFLARGVVLIDTPGVGSTHRHNSATADAVLPECDATLFVVSPDPPITPVEVEFLARIRQTVAHLTIVLNKIDTLEPNEQSTAVAFLRGVLTEEAQLPADTPIFCLSARGALRTMQNGEDRTALEATGFLELERRLGQFLATEKQTTLKAAIARKASACTRELQLETDIALKSLRLPLQDLEERLQTFDEATGQFESERRAAADLLTGDRLRALEELEKEAERLRTEGRAVLTPELDRLLASGRDVEETRALLTEKVIAFFDDALGEVVREVRVRLRSVFSVHQERADALITLVRQTAANLLQIPFHAPESSEAFETRRDPFWVTSARNVELSPIPAGALDGFLPRPMREKRIRRRLLEEMDSVLRRNVENLRWATRQNLEDAFRRFGAELDERLALSLDATRGAMKAALDRRRQHSEAAEAEIIATESASTRLSELAVALALEGKALREATK